MKNYITGDIEQNDYLEVVSYITVDGFQPTEHLKQISDGESE